MPLSQNNKCPKGRSEELAMEKIEIFLQVEGTKDILLVEVKKNGTVRDLLLVAAEHGRHPGNDDIPAMVFIEDMENVLEIDELLENAGVHHRAHVHIHRCRHIEVTVNFNGKNISKTFPPSATIGRVKNGLRRNLECLKRTLLNTFFRLVVQEIHWM